MTPIIQIRALLVAEPAISAMVDDRVFYSVAPQGAALPHVVLLRGPESEAYSLLGASGLEQVDMNIVVKSKSFTESAEIGAALLDLLRFVEIDASGRRLLITREPGGGHDFIPDGSVHRRVLTFGIRVSRQ